MEQITEQNQKAATAQILEALLFHYGEPMSEKDIAKNLSITEDEVKNLIINLKERYEDESSSSLTLLEDSGRVRLVTKKELAWVNQKLTKDNLKEELTPVAQETLALIAYLGPIGRPVIDFIRGVNTSFTLRSLLMRGLIERVSGIKGTLQYKITLACLEHLGIKSIAELPDYEKYRDYLNRFETKENTKTNV